MKPTLRNSLCLLFSAALLSGCATTNEVTGLKRQIRMLNRKVEEMKSGTVGQIERRQASATGHMEQLRQDIEELRSQVEESYYLSQQLREQNKELQNSISSVAREESTRREEALQKLQEEQAAKEAKLRELDGLLRKQEANVQAIQQARLREAERKAKAAEIEAKMAGKRTSQQARPGKKRSSSADSSLSAPTRSREILATRKKVIRQRPEQLAETGRSGQKLTRKKVPVTAPVRTPEKSTAEEVKKTTQPTTETAATTVQPAAPTPTPAPAPDPAPAAQKPVFTGGAAAVSGLAEGRKLLAQKKYAEAVAVLEKVARDTGSRDRIEANFLLGQALFARKDYVGAVNNFQEVVGKSPGSRLAPQALLLQAQSFEKLADLDTAKVLYLRISKQYSSSPEAATAKKRLEDL